MHINLEAFNARAGFRGIIVVSLALLMVSAFGQPGTVLAISAIFVSLADNPGPYTARFKRIGEFTLLGASVTLLAWVFGGGMWAVVISTLLITFTCGMALSYGSMIAIPAVLLNLWYVTAIPMVDPIELWQAVFGFIGGGLLVAIVATLNTVIYSLWQKGEEEEGKAEPDLEASSEEAVEEATEEAEEEMSGTAAEEANEKAGETVRTETGTETEGTEEEKTGGARKADLRANLRWTSPVFQFSTVKSLAGGLSTLAGWLIVSGHPFWAAYAPLAIIKPDVHQTTVSGVERIAGTVIGGLLGVLLVTSIENPAVLQLLFIASVFFMLATLKVSYTIFISFVTLMLVISGGVGGESFSDTGKERIIATVLGVLITFVVIIILSRMVHRKDNQEPVLENV